jgi:UDP-glucose 4-epimerase
MTILVTGSSGHLGEALIRLLRERGEEVRGLDIKPSLYTGILGSIANRELVREAMRDVRTVFHTATLHKPHVVTHTHAQFVETNVTGTLNLLEEAADAGVGAFIQTSTTSTFGDALSPPPGTPAAWIVEDVLPVPKNIYGATKLAAEHLCRVVAKKRGLAVVVLRTSRFFPEEDDSAEVREAFSNDNIQALELLYRRADIEDMALAHLAAMKRAPAIGFGMAIVSATSPFTQADLPLINKDAGAVIHQHFPESTGLFAQAGWNFLPTIDRVYVNDHARALLGWEPKRSFAHVLRCLERGEDFRSDLARAIGRKGYHDEVFAEGPYPV